MNIHNMHYINYIMEIIDGKWLDYLDKNKVYKLVTLNGYYDLAAICTLFEPDFQSVGYTDPYDDPIEEYRYSFAVYFLENGQQRVITLLDATKYECIDAVKEIYRSRVNAIYLAARCCVNN
ncbi:CRPV-046 [Crowpox virus]|nr:CRPV-046 [Crowpox virus]